MSAIKELKNAIETGEYADSIRVLYPAHQGSEQPKRLLDLVTLFEEKYGVPSHKPRIFSSPGRTEVGGNHTDHQHGRVLSAAVNMDAVAIAAKTDDATIRIQSVGFPEDIIELDNLEKNPEEENKAVSLLRGICARMEELGHSIGGFIAYTTSDVPAGSGLSSSAAFENLIATILNHLYNEGAIDPVTLAQISQYAENEYFGKPSGLLDQATSSVGGFITIDFNDTQNPVVRPINFDFGSTDHALCIVDTGGDHADLTDDYAAITNEMSNVAAFFDKDVLRQVDESAFFDNIANLREKTGDRAILRGIHFFGDNNRVPQQVEALESGDFNKFKQLVIDSGRSSFMLLQNVYACSQVNHQGLSLALALSEKMLAPVGGAWRVHGGGFAGTIQAFVPNTSLASYRTAMDAIFGEGACRELIVRPVGATELTAK